MNPRIDKNRRPSPHQPGRLAAVLVAMGTCAGLLVSLNAFTSASIGSRHASRYWSAAPIVQNAWVGALPGIEASATAAVILLLLWGLRVRFFAAPKSIETLLPARDVPQMPILHADWLRSIHRGGRHGP